VYGFVRRKSECFGHLATGDGVVALISSTLDIGGHTLASMAELTTGLVTAAPVSAADAGLAAASLTTPRL